MLLSKEARAIRRTDVLLRKNIDKARLNSSDREPNVDPSARSFPAQT